MTVSLEAFVPELDVLREEPLSRHTTFRIGGPAELFGVPRSEEALRGALRWAEMYSVPWRVIGNGSNLLVSDQGLRGLTLKLTGLSSLSIAGDVVTAGCGTLLSRLSVFAMERGLGGLAFAQGIPGTVGGGVLMNAGAYGGEMSHTLLESRCLDETGQVRTLAAEAHGFAYRHSCYADCPGRVIVGASFRLTPCAKEEIRREMEAFSRRRREKQPLQYPSAGSVFKRPPGQYAGALIQQCGLKGLRMGGAEVSELHAGFIINRGGATCADVLRLISHIQETVLRETGFLLEPELRVLRDA